MLTSTTRSGGYRLLSLLRRGHRRPLGAEPHLRRTSTPGRRRRWLTTTVALDAARADRGRGHRDQPFRYVEGTRRSLRTCPDRCERGGTDPASLPTVTPAAAPGTRGRTRYSVPAGSRRAVPVVAMTVALLGAAAIMISPITSWTMAPGHLRNRAAPALRGHSCRVVAPELVMAGPRSAPHAVATCTADGVAVARGGTAGPGRGDPTAPEATPGLTRYRTGRTDRDAVVMGQ